MAAATDPSYQVRQGLVSKGVNPGDIGYKNGYVTVGGNNFMQPSKVLNGVSYDSQQNFDNAWNNYQKSLNQTPSTSTAGTTGYSSGTPSVTPNVTPYSPYNTNNPYDSQYNTLLSSLLQQAQNPTPIDVNQIYASPQYAAYQAQAQRGAQQATRAAQESLGASGFGRSSTLAERAQANQNDANTYLNTQVLPALMSQAQQEQQQQYSNLYNMLGQLGQQQGVYDNRYNNANNLAISKGQLLGNYIDPQAASIIDAILREKQNYGTATDAAGRDQARANAEAYRSQLAGLGYDPSAFGADRTLQQAQAGYSGAGIPTLAAQNQTFNQGIESERLKMDKENQALDKTQIMAQLTGYLPDGTKTNALQQQELQNLWTVADRTGTIPDKLADLYDLPHGTQTQDAYQFAQNLQISRDQLANQTAGVALDYEKYNNPSGGESKSTSGLTPNQIYDAIRTQFATPTYDADGKSLGSKLPTGKDERAAMIVQILQSSKGLPDAQREQIAASLGITSDEWKSVTGHAMGE